MITHSRVRRKRMGHINLAAPVAHIWFFKAMPSRLGTLLGLKTASLEKVIYFQDYIVTDAGDTPLKALQLLSEDEYRQSRQKYGMAFQAGMGAESVRELLRALDLPLLSETLREDRSEEALSDAALLPRWAAIDGWAVVLLSLELPLDGRQGLRRRRGQSTRSARIWAGVERRDFGRLGWSGDEGLALRDRCDDQA